MMKPKKIASDHLANLSGRIFDALEKSLESFTAGKIDNAVTFSTESERLIQMFDYDRLGEHADLSQKMHGLQSKLSRAISQTQHANHVFA